MIDMKKLPSDKQTHVIAVTGGKGGVGKSITTVNVAEMLTHLGYRVAVIDADAGLSNCATLLNENVSATVYDWVSGHCYLEDLPHSLDAFTLVTASDEPGQNMATLMSALDQVTEYLKSFNDFIFIDTPAGAGEITLWALDQADIGLLVLVDEPTSVLDAYRLCKYIYNIDPKYHFANIVNHAQSQQSAFDTSERFNNLLAYFLNTETDHFGFLPSSKEIRELVSRQHTMLQGGELTIFEKELKYICENIIGFFNRNELHQTQHKQIV
ncbi:MAG: P-loop NTPase [Balneolia bacterium]|nr:P-loop NTPase [Balneolia bacterium]